MIAKVKAIGERGSSYSTVNGERLPCVHQANMKPDGWYRASTVSDTQHLQLLDAIRDAGKVIVRRSVRQPDQDTWESKGYVAVFSVADAALMDDELRFRFVERLHDLK